MPVTELAPGTTCHGFTVLENLPLAELNATLIRLRDDKTGARVLHLATEDDNNLFGVGFRTTPTDSTGVAHILEHTVLCGSLRFPVRDPFFSMIKRSLNTFMNALTSSDWTLYPFSSQNEKDFYNLMAVYLDAAFFPLLRERDFRQEGHRLEFAEPDNPSSPLVFKGVVYNEMKGAMADPSSLMGRRLVKHLYPTTTYGFNSGGEPSDIPDLSWEGLRTFHTAAYHPANAWFFTYGNLPLAKHLETIRRQVLDRFEPLEIDTSVPDEVRYQQPRRAVETFPVDAGEPLARRTMVQLGWLTCPVADSVDRLALSVLANLLLGSSAAPLYKALVESGLGQNLAPGTGYHDDSRETMFAAGLQGTDPEQAEAIEALVLDTLRRTAAAGFSPERIEAAIHQLEFSHREVTGDQYPYPLILLMRIMGPWLHADDPTSTLRLDQTLGRLRREAQDPGYFPGLIHRFLLDNPHRVTLTLKPDPDQKAREEQATADRLAAIRRTLSDEDCRRIVAQAKELREAQEAQEDLSVLPTLELSDIPAEERAVPFVRDTLEQVPLYYFDQPTNGIGYFTACFTLEGLPEELRADLPLFCALLPQVGAAGQGYEELAERITAHTGGIRASALIFDDPRQLGRFRPLLEVRGKALVRKQAELFGILSDLLKAPDFTDTRRLHQVLGQLKTSLENSIPGSGHTYAARAAGAALTPAGRQREEWGGLDFLRRVRQLAGLQPEELGKFAARLARIAATLFRRDRLQCALTAEANRFAAIEPPLRALLVGLEASGPDGGPPPPPAAHGQRCTGWATSVPVSYVARVFATATFTDPDAPALLVLARLLRAGFLHREIREKGGAYGGMAGFDNEAGIFSLLSYRDPNITRTLAVYRQAAEWAARGDFSAQDLKEAILATFAAVDKPLSPGGRGHREFLNQLQGLTPELRQQVRQGILAVDREDLIRVSRRHLLDRWEEGAVAVISGEEPLKRANAELDGALRVERI